jgi:hypothetical protein
MKSHTLATLLALSGLGLAQVPEPPVPASTAPQPAPAASAAPTAPSAAPAAQSAKPGGTLGNDLPMFNPGTEIFTWDGKNWNVNNNRLFEARFEKYLNAPEESTDEDKQYRTIIEMILRYLAPGNASSQNIDLAFKLLPQASRYDIDARLCDSLADAVYTVWQAQRQQTRLASANNVLQYEIMSLEASTRHQATVTENVKTTRAATQVGGGSGGRRGQQTPQQQAQSSPTTQAADVKQAALETNNWQTRRLA